MRQLLLLLTTLVALANVALAARAQSLPAIVAPSAVPSHPPGVRVEGIYQTAPVRLEGHILFRIATPATGNGMGAEVRASYIQDILEEILAKRSAEPDSATVFDPATFRVESRPEGAQAVLFATDGTHKTPFTIMTVTTVDARYQRIPVEEVAEQWRAILQTSLVAALEKRQPAQVKKNTTGVLRVGIALLAITILAWLFGRLARRRIDAASKEIEQAAGAIEEARASQSIEEPQTEEKRQRFVDSAIRAIDPQMRLSFWRAMSAMSFWAVLLAWFGALIWGLSLFPQTAALGQDIGRRAIRVLFIWLVAAVLSRGLDVAVARVASTSRDLVRLRHVKEKEKARQLLRIPTLVRASHDFFSVVIFFGAGLATLSAIGLPIASVLTIGGLIAFAVTFSAQNMVRDFLNGFLVLLEDQCVIGDYVRIGEWAGMVENMTLRIVQLRDASGNLVTIPYGVASVIVNASRYWSRIDYRVAIAVDADVGKALQVMRKTLERLAADPQWHDAILNPVEWAGVEGVGAGGVLLRASVRTAPLRQFELRREVNARVVAAFREAGIAFGTDPEALK